MLVLPTDELVRTLVRERLAGADPGLLAWRFHAALAAMASDACEAVRSESGLGVCALTGGVFQNRLLTAMTAHLLRQNGFRVLLHGMIPPNDGGIGAGQALAAMYHLNNPKHSSILKQGDGLCV